MNVRHNGKTRGCQVPASVEARCHHPPKHDWCDDGVMNCPDWLRVLSAKPGRRNPDPVFHCRSTGERRMLAQRTNGL